MCREAYALSDLAFAARGEESLSMQTSLNFPLGLPSCQKKKKLISMIQPKFSEWS